jgi:hypothetical protein
VGRPRRRRLPAPPRADQPGDWSVDADLNVTVNGQVVKPDSSGRLPVLLIPGYHEGILNFGRDALHDAKQLYWIVRDRLANPVALTELHQKSGGPGSPRTSATTLLSEYRANRNLDGGVVRSPPKTSR